MPQGHPASDRRALSEVRVHDVEQFLHRPRPLGGRLAIGIGHVVPDVALDHLGHEPIDGAPRGGDGPEGGRAVSLSIKRLGDGIDLPLDPAHPVEELLLVPDGVGHGA